MKISQSLTITLIVVLALEVVIVKASGYDSLAFQVQKALEILNYKPGATDGIWGKKTKEALEQFERDHGLPLTGRLNPQSLAALGIKGLAGVVKEVNFDQHRFTVSMTGASDRLFTYDENTTFSANDGETTPFALKSGMEASIYWKTINGEPVPGITGVTHFYEVATHVFLFVAVQDLAITSPRFFRNGDGTITDTKKSLMWQITPNPKQLGYQEACDYCKGLQSGGFTNWRLPLGKEADEGLAVELMMPKRSQGSADWFWSADSCILIPFNYSATQLSICPAYVRPEDATTLRGYVRCVRSMKEGEK